MNYFTEPLATELENKRAHSRLTKERLTIDCFNAIYPREGTRVYCKKGHKLDKAKDGTMELASVLTGRRGLCCRLCDDFDNGGENADGY